LFLNIFLIKFLLMIAMTVKDSKYIIPIKFKWAFARPNVDHLLEDTGKRYLYKTEKDKLTTVADFSEDMLSHVNEEYVRTREAEIVNILEMTCLSGIKGVPGILASFVFSVDEIRLHFHVNIIENSLHEYGEPKSEFVEAIEKVKKTLCQHNLIEFMHNLFRCRLTWLDDGGGESKIIIEHLLKLLYGNGTSILVTFKEAGVWSWQHLYHGGEPEHGVVYDVKDSRGMWYEGIFYKRDEVAEKLENTGKFNVHYINWSMKSDEWLGLSALSNRVATRGSKTKGPHLDKHMVFGMRWTGKTEFLSNAFIRWIVSLRRKQKADILEAITALRKRLINFEDVASIAGVPVDFVRIMIANLTLQWNNYRAQVRFSISDRYNHLFWIQLLRRWSSIHGRVVA